MDITKANTGFTVDQLLNGKLKKEDFQINYLPMWSMLDTLETKIKGGLASMPMEDVLKRVYEFAVISISLDKSDMQTRIDQLNEKNLIWHMKAMDLEAENTLLKERIVELNK